MSRKPSDLKPMREQKKVFQSVVIEKPSTQYNSQFQPQTNKFANTISDSVSGFDNFRQQLINKTAEIIAKAMAEEIFKPNGKNHMNDVGAIVISSIRKPPPVQLTGEGGKVLPTH